MMKKTDLCRSLCIFLLLVFLLGIHEGRIALWKDGDSTPWRVFPYPVAALPLQTQQQLQKGMRVDTMEDLDRLLENLLS